MSLSLVTAPAIEPISLQEAKDHLRVTHAVEDALIEALITAVRQHLDGRDGVLNRQLLTATWDYSRDYFPRRDNLHLPLAPVQSITSVTYVDTDGATQTLDSSKYTLSADTTTAPAVVLAYDETWPVTRAIRDAVTVRFVAGYGDNSSDVPGTIKQAMLLMIDHWYSHRDLMVVGAGGATEIPFAADSLLASYKRENLW